MIEEYTSCQVLASAHLNTCAYTPVCTYFHEYMHAYTTYTQRKLVLSSNFLSIETEGKLVNLGRALLDVRHSCLILTLFLLGQNTVSSLRGSSCHYLLLVSSPGLLFPLLSDDHMVSISRGLESGLEYMQNIRQQMGHLLFTVNPRSIREEPRLKLRA